MSKTVIVTLDLDSGRKPNYTKLDNLMKNKYGLDKLSPKKGLKLPHNTYMGTFTGKVSDFKRSLLDALDKGRFFPKAILGGELKHWSITRVPKKKK